MGTVEKIGVLGVRCPTCYANPNEPCTHRVGRYTTGRVPHRSRTILAMGRGMLQ